MLGLILIAGCIQQAGSEAAGKGLLQGRVSIGPLCPAERPPPDPGCLPTEETYKAWPIAVWTEDKKTMVALLQPDLDGAYEIELPPGSYVVDLEKQHRFGSSNLPARIDIRQNETTTLNIDIDTGIR